MELYQEEHIILFTYRRVDNIAIICPCQGFTPTHKLDRPRFTESQGKEAQCPKHGGVPDRAWVICPKLVTRFIYPRSLFGVLKGPRCLLQISINCWNSRAGKSAPGLRAVICQWSLQDRRDFSSLDATLPPTCCRHRSAPAPPIVES